MLVFYYFPNLLHIFQNSWDILLLMLSLAFGTFSVGDKLQVLHVQKMGSTVCHPEFSQSATVLQLDFWGMVYSILLKKTYTVCIYIYIHFHQEFHGCLRTLQQFHFLWSSLNHVQKFLIIVKFSDISFFIQ